MPDRSRSLLDRAAAQVAATRLDHAGTDRRVDELVAGLCPVLAADADPYVVALAVADVLRAVVARLLGGGHALPGAQRPYQSVAARPRRSAPLPAQGVRPDAATTSLARGELLGLVPVFLEELVALVAQDHDLVLPADLSTATAAAAALDHPTSNSLQDAVLGVLQLDGVQMPTRSRKPANDDSNVGAARPVEQEQPDAEPALAAAHVATPDSQTGQDSEPVGRDPEETDQEAPEEAPTRAGGQEAADATNPVPEPEAADLTDPVAEEARREPEARKAEWAQNRTQARDVAQERGEEVLRQLLQAAASGVGGAQGIGAVLQQIVAGVAQPGGQPNLTDVLAAAQAGAQTGATAADLRAAFIGALQGSLLGVLKALGIALAPASTQQPVLQRPPAPNTPAPYAAVGPATQPPSPPPTPPTPLPSPSTPQQAVRAAALAGVQQGPQPGALFGALKGGLLGALGGAAPGLALAPSASVATGMGGSVDDWYRDCVPEDYVLPGMLQRVDLHVDQEAVDAWHTLVYCTMVGTQVVAIADRARDSFAQGHLGCFDLTPQAQQMLYCYEPQLQAFELKRSRLAERLLGTGSQGQAVTQPFAHLFQQLTLHVPDEAPGDRVDRVRDATESYRSVLSRSVTPYDRMTVKDLARMQWRAQTTVDSLGHDFWEVVHCLDPAASDRLHTVVEDFHRRDKLMFSLIRQPGAITTATLPARGLLAGYAGQRPLAAPRQAAERQA